jgi:hypothetical protein
MSFDAFMMRLITFAVQLTKFVVLIPLLLCACSDRKEKPFRLVPASESQITFVNRLHETAEFNIFNYLYFYNGGGVSVGDVNGDQLLDIYFTSNQQSNKLYLNRGGLKFEDVTKRAAVEADSGWKTGVTMADVNGDGRIDIYVSCLGDYRIYHGKNLLYINEGNDENGIPRFKESASEFGLDLVGFSTQASFFDYDLDGDLDMFMLTHSVHDNGTYGKSSLRFQSHPLAGDKLMRNDNGKFIDVTEHAGIYNSVLGYGLGVVVSDVNLDGWPDIYVGNDFHENDYLYINQGNGTFKETVESAMQHTSRYTMGVDFADFNNDAFPDLISMDMLPSDPVILKASMAEDPYDVYNFKLGFGYNHQFARNNLQLNNQDGTFSDIALEAGVAATDWSWATFFADFNLDGNKDLFVANGIERRSNDLDYINFIEVDSIQRKIAGNMGARELRYIEKLPQIKIPNYLFVNNGDSTFTDVTKAWGIEQPSYSNGAAYADFDNDGDLDIIVNNLESEAMLYENRFGNDTTNHQANHYLQIFLKGKPGNTFGLGTKVIIYNHGKLQHQECMPTRGFQSSVDYRLTFGTGNALKVDSLTVIWNTGEFQTVKNVKTSQSITLQQEDASGRFNFNVFHKIRPVFINISDSIRLPYHHRENHFVEFNREQLIPHMLSVEGPACAVADINGDGNEDIFLGGAKWQPGVILSQTSAGQFSISVQSDIASDSSFEDVDAEFFDVDGDRDKDLFVVSGGNEFTGRSKFNQPRIYINDGKGHFSKSGSMPQIYLSGSCLSTCDFDNDGDTDVFIGARAVPWRYGVPPDSYLLLNDGAGQFKDVTALQAPELKSFGFVKHASWADIDGDKDKDLLVAAEWSPLTIFLNDAGNLKPLDIDGSGLEYSNGWWNFIDAFDVDADGDLDIIAGNLGLNSKLKASREYPVKMFVGDFDHNDSTDQVISHYVDGVEYPFNTRDELTKQMPFLKKRFLSYHKFAESTLREVFSTSQLNDAHKFTAYTFESSYIENLGGHKFKIMPLPRAVQFSTVESMAVTDFNHDNKADILFAGNYFPVNIQRGRYDANYGGLLAGNGKGQFLAMCPVNSGISVSGEIRKIQRIIIGRKECFLMIRNNDSVEVLTLAHN